MKKKDPKNVKRGRLARTHGAEFERRTRKNLEEKGWNVSKYQNNVEFNVVFERTPGMTSIQEIPNEVIKGKSVPAKASRFRLSSTGFPDFIAYKLIGKEEHDQGIDYVLSDALNELFEKKYPYKIIFVECKVNGYLDKTEKAKARWYLDNNFCSKFIIAKKGKRVGRKIPVIYTDFVPTSK